MRWLVKLLWQIGIDLAAIAAAVRFGFDIARKAPHCYRSGGRFSGVNKRLVDYQDKPRDDRVAIGHILIGYALPFGTETF